MRALLVPKERGQTLVIVALAMTVLMLMAGLAVDVGMAYNDRRDMQNAADAGALAGAQRLCDGLNDTTAAATARDVAVRLNGADNAMTAITSGNFTVNVVAGTNAATFFMKLIGIAQVPVSAEAEAKCGCASAAGATWPVLFDQASWDTMGSCETDPDLEVNFIVWSSKANKQPEWPDDTCVTCDCARAEADLGLPAGYLSTVEEWGAGGLWSGDRGWARLGKPNGYTPPDWYTKNIGDSCGINMVELWLRVGYTGIVDEDFCVPGKPGIGSAIRGAEDQIDRRVSVLLFDGIQSKQQCGTNMVGEQNNAKCDTGNSNYVISGFGCVWVREWTESFKLYGKNSNKDCSAVKNLGEAIFVTKVCSGCQVSGTGASGPLTPYPGCIVAASLVK